MVWNVFAQAFTEEQRAELHAVEAQIRRRIAIGSTVSERKLKVNVCRHAALGTSCCNKECRSSVLIVSELSAMSMPPWEAPPLSLIVAANSLCGSNSGSVIPARPAGTNGCSSSWHCRLQTVALSHSLQPPEEANLWSYM